MSAHCTNCSAQLDTPWCGQCGQRAAHGRLDLHELAHDAWHAITHLDGGLPRLLRGLATRPARVYAEYLAGARKRYFNPVIFLLMASGAYILLGTAALKRYVAVMGRTNQAAAETVVLQADKYRYLMALPMIIVLSWALSRRRYHLAEVAVFWLFCIGFVIVCETTGLPLQWLWPAHRESIKYVFGWVAGLMMLWHVVAFFGERRPIAIARCVAIVCSALIVLNYATRMMYRINGFDVSLGVVPTLRDTFGL
jgi:Protein of unknown function (DUF3667)